MTRGSTSGGIAPLTAQRKWRAITLATLVLVPAYWAILIGVVSTAADTGDEIVDNPEAAIALGLALIPFSFIVLAFLSEHPRAPGAAAKAMGLSLLIGLPVAAVAADVVTGIVAGVGSGGIVALRAEPLHSWRARAIGVLVAATYTFVLVRVAAGLALLPAPVFPFTAVGMADLIVERRHDRETDAR